MQTSGRDAWRPREVAGGKIRKIPLPAPPPAAFFAPLRQRPLLRPATDSPPTDYPGPSDRPRPTLLPPADDPPSPARKAPAGHPPPDLPPPRCQPPTLRRPAASHRPSAAPRPAADPSPSRSRPAARRANAARTCFCLFLRAACTIFVALPGPHLARPLHGRPGAGHKPLSPA